MDNRDLIRIQHMIEAAEEAVGYCANISRESLEAEHLTTLGIIKCIEIVGEAASRVSLQTRESVSEVPWELIVGMRNRLVHVYFDVDMDQVWTTVKVDLPDLIERLKNAISGY